MTRRMTAWMGSLAMLLLGCMTCAQAAAQCGGPMKTSLRLPRAVAGGAVLHLASLGGQETEEWGDERDRHGLEPIVGLWRSDYEDPEAHYSDKGYQAWHADFTEFLNSGRVPSTGAVCQGVWEKVGRSKFRLNHFAMAFADNAHYTSLIQIRETVTVDPSRNHFQGRFTIKAYDPQTHAFQGEYKGIVTGDRVRMDSTVEEQ